MAIKPSPCLAMLLLLFHAMVATVVYATMLPPAAKLAMLIPILPSLLYYLARDALLLFPDSWREVSFENHPHPNLLPEGERTIASSPASGITSDLAALPPSRMASGFIRELRRGLGRVSVVTRDGSGFSGQVSSKTTVSPYFIVLRVRLDGHRLPVFRTIFPDALDKCAFRELRVHLKFAQ
jgi:hypothetical protein